MQTDRPEGLSLVLDDEGELRIEDAQEAVHIRFGLGAGDPTSWSAGIVTDTCAALGIKQAYDYREEGDGFDTDTPIPTVIERWHERNLASGGFLP